MRTLLALAGIGAVGYLLLRRKSAAPTTPQVPTTTGPETIYVSHIPPGGQTAPNIGPTVVQVLGSQGAS